MASSVFNPRALQSFSAISLQVFFGLPLGLVPSTLYSIDFFTQSLSSFRNTCPYHRNLFCCSTEIMSSNPSLSLNYLLGTLSCNFTPHIHLAILISALWSATSFSFLTEWLGIGDIISILLQNRLRWYVHVLWKKTMIEQRNQINQSKLFVTHAMLCTSSNLRHMEYEWSGWFQTKRWTKEDPERGGAKRLSST